MSTHQFPGATVNFILATKVVCTLFKEYNAELAPVNTNWTPEFADNLDKRVDTIAGDYLGKNVRDLLFSITKNLVTAISAVKVDLATVKKNIDIDFKKTDEYSTVISSLGLNVKSISNLTQPKLIALLSTFKRNLTPELLTKITSGGMPADVPNRVAASAAAIIDLNNQQETLKSSAKEATGTMLLTLNNLYADIIKICKRASDFYKKNPAKKNLFFFNGIMRNLGETRIPKEETEETTEKKTSAI